MTNPIQEAQSLGQSIWLDFISRGLISTGQLKQLVEERVSGMTSNPTIFHKSVTMGTDYDGAIRAIVESDPGIDTKALYDRLIVEDIQMAANVFLPVFDGSDGLNGLVSLEPTPELAYDTNGTMAEVRRLWGLVDRPNVMMKVPATPQGIPAIESLIAEGVNVNITLMFSMKHYEAVSHAYIRGIAKHSSPERIVSVASFFVSRVDTYVDRELERIGTEEALALRGKAAIANSKLVYRRFREIFFGGEFAEQRKRGARVQRVLWGSTSTKNPAYPDLLYVEGLMGADTVNTVPLETLDGYRHHGRARPTLGERMEEAEQVLAELGKVGVNLDAITEQLQEDGMKAFADSYDQLMAALEEKRKQV